MADVSQAIREFIVREFMGDRRDAVLADDTQLIEDGIVDSLGIFVLVAFLEKEFGVKVRPEDVVLDNFESVSTIRDLVTQRQAGAAGA
jgi:acyl carrier protein